MDTLLATFTTVQLLPDLSQHTLQRHKNLEAITKVLRIYKIPHKWKYPVTLSVTHNGVTTRLNTLKEGLRALYQWNILPDPPPSDPHQAHPGTLHLDCQVVSHKRSSKNNAFGGSWAFFNSSTPIWPTLLHWYPCLLLLCSPFGSVHGPWYGSIFKL